MHRRPRCLRPSSEVSSPEAFCLVFSQSVVDFDSSSVALGFITKASEGASLTSLSAVAGIFTYITAAGSDVSGPDAIHVLPHRADKVILLLVVIEVVAVEGIGSVTGTVLDMKTVVFYVGLHAGFFHEAVVLFGTVSGVGHGNGWQMTVAVKKRVEERYQCKGICGIGEQGEVGDELVLG